MLKTLPCEENRVWICRVLCRRFEALLGIFVSMRRDEATQRETKRDETRRYAFQVSRNSVAVGYDRSNSRPTTGDAISKLISIFYLHAPASPRQFYTSAIFRGVGVSLSRVFRRNHVSVDLFADREERKFIDRSNREQPI